MNLEMNDYNEKLNKCIAYFKSTPGFYRIFEKIRQNYLSLGRVGGSIRLNNLNEDEKVCLSRLLHKDYYSKKSIDIPVESITKSLDKYTIFKDLGLKDILFRYYGENILSKKEVQKRYKDARMEYFMKILNDYKGLASFDWIIQSFELKNALYKTLIKRYDENKVLLKKDLHIITNAYEKLKKYKALEKKERLPIFAANIAKNPHAFDKKETVYILLIEAVCHILQKPKPNNAEEESLLFYEVGIVKDEISNFTTLWGLEGFIDDIAHKAWEAFKNLKEPFNANILNLNGIDKITAPNEKAYVFENPAVFTDVCQRLKDREVGLICSYGQIKYASLLLMDKLVNSGSVLYYNGDYDPEGLQIAEGLKKRYGDRLILWRFDKATYLKSLSHEIINRKRLNRLNSLKCQELISLAEIIEAKKRVGYQELIIDNLVNDIVSNLR